MATLSELRQANTPAVQNPEVALAKPGYDSAASFEGLQRIGKMFASSTMVPAQFRGMQNIGNTCIALEMALRMKASPMMVLQNMYMVQGKPGWSTQFLIACFNQTGRFSSIRYEFEGQPGTDSWGCRATATELSTGEKVQGTLVTMAIAKREGWYGKSGSKWQTMPEQMLRYRAAAWLIRSVAPEVAMGMYTVDELRDIERDERQAVQVQAQPVQVEPEPEHVQPKKRGRKPKAEIAPEPIDVDIEDFLPVQKTPARQKAEEACANFEDYPMDTDAVIRFLTVRQNSNIIQATEFLASEADTVLPTLAEEVKANLPTREEAGTNEAAAHDRLAAFTAQTFQIDFDGTFMGRALPSMSTFSDPEIYLHHIGTYIRNN